MTIRPILEYGPGIWGAASKTLLSKTNSIQHTFLVRSIGVNIYSHKVDVYVEAKASPKKLDDKYKYYTILEIIIVVYKAVYLLKVIHVKIQKEIIVLLNIL